MVAEAINSKLLYSVILNVLGLKISSSSTYNANPEYCNRVKIFF